MCFYPFLDGDVPHSPSYGIYISQLHVPRFVRVCTNVTGFNLRKNVFRLLSEKDLRALVLLCYCCRVNCLCS